MEDSRRDDFGQFKKGIKKVANSGRKKEGLNRLTKVKNEIDTLSLDKELNSDRKALILSVLFEEATEKKSEKAAQLWLNAYENFFNPPEGLDLNFDSLQKIEESGKNVLKSIINKTLDFKYGKELLSLLTVQKNIRVDSLVKMLEDYQENNKSS